MSRRDDSRIEELDGFRAIAVSLVFVMHIGYGSRLPDGALDWMPGLVRQIVSHGWLGVDLFFLLSGFLITGILLQSRGSEHYLRNFYARRALRILPLYFVCIAVMALLYTDYLSYFGLALGFLANFAHAFAVPEPHGPGVFWSLAIEEHFYLLWPLLVLWLPRRRLLWLAFLIVILTPVLRGYCAMRGMDPELEIYMYSFFRFDGLALGALLAIWWQTPPADRIGHWPFAMALAVISLGVTAAGLPYGIMGSKTVAAAALRYTQAQLMFAAMIVLALGYRNTRMTAILRCGPARFLAEISFCVYLIHLALIDLYLYIIRSLQWNDYAALGAVGVFLFRMVVVASVSVGIALLSLKYLEKPALRLRRHFPA
jgi:peptidoglycan/LPS O-acetylase OafA/YrhL